MVSQGFQVTRGQAVILDSVVQAVRVFQDSQAYRATAVVVVEAEEQVVSRASVESQATAVIQDSQAQQEVTEQVGLVGFLEQAPADSQASLQLRDIQDLVHRVGSLDSQGQVEAHRAFQDFQVSAVIADTVDLAGRVDTQVLLVLAGTQALVG